MSTFKNFINSYKRSNKLTQLIYINSIVFVLINTLEIISKLFNLSTISLLLNLALPSSISLLLEMPWTLISYMFLHEELFHYFFNMLSLYWFGRLFSMYFTEKQLIGLYITGGLSGALFYIISFLYIPYFQNLTEHNILLGASAAVMSIIVAIATAAPNMNLQMMFIGGMKLKYIALIAVATSFFSITSSNGGGQIAHLGGALAGYIFVVSLQNKIDITHWINWIFDLIVGRFKSPKLKVKPVNHPKGKKMTDEEFNMHKAERIKSIDNILDKIKTSGYDSLTTEEKKRLFEQGNRTT